jgi:hypothetical protein
MQKTDEEKGPDAPNNLFAPLEGGPVGPQGSFSKEARSWSLYTWWETHPQAHWIGRALAVIGFGWLVSRRRDRPKPRKLNLKKAALAAMVAQRVMAKRSRK